MTTRTRRGAGAATLVACVAIAGLATAAASSAAAKPAVLKSAAPRPAVQVASVSTGGALADTFSRFSVLSAGGKYVAFSSAASNLVPGDTNGQEDVFVRDLARGLTRRATLDTAGEQAFGTTATAAGLSKDGRYVAFTADAGNLVPGDTNQHRDVFVRDLRYGITTRASLTSDGSEISNFSVGDGISGDGRYVVYTTYCGCVMPGETFTDTSDVYVRDLKKGTTRRVSVASDGAGGNGSSDTAAISADGRYVVFTSQATNLVPGDTNGTSDVFRHDLKTGVTIRVSVGPGGRQTSGGKPGGGANHTFASDEPSVSESGRYVAFFSYGQGLIDGPHATGDVYRRDVKTGTTTLVSAGRGGGANDSAPDHPALPPSISGDGRYVGFTSYSTNLVAGDTNGVADGFVRDLKRGITRRVTVNAAGEQANATSGFDLAIDHDGDTAVFTSAATNLVPADANGELDVYVARLKK
jgi:Tol biopolymer transport system component